MVKLLGGKRSPKHVSLNDHTVEMVSQFAERHSLNFSQAIERLALIGLQDTKTTGLATLMVDVVRSEMARSFNRFAKLIVYAGLEAGAAKHAAHALLFLQLLDLAADTQDPAGLAGKLSIDLETPMGQEVVKLYKQRENRYRWQAVKALKKPIAELQDVLAELKAGPEGEP